MAWITVRNAEVTNVFYNGLGAKIKESFTKGDGTPGAAYFSAFFTEPHGLEVGSLGTFGGTMGAKATEFEGKWRAEITLNNTTFQPVEGNGGF